MPVEPMGASLALMRFTREKKASAFEMFKRLNQINPDSPEGMFCIAVMMRGGVLGEEEKSRSKPDVRTSGSESIDTDTAD